MSPASAVGAGLRLISAALVVLGVLVLAMALKTSPSAGEAPRWVHVLSALPFFFAGVLSYRIGSYLRRDRSL
jgi:hypothetical protein